MKRILQYTTLVSVVLSLLVACEAGDPNIESAKLNLKNKDYDKALESVNKAIESDSTNAYAYYYKGNIYFEAAKAQANPSDRLSYYENMKTALKKARSMYELQAETDPKAILQTTQIDNLLNNSWAVELNNALKLVQEEQTTPEQFDLSLAHMNNATIINPDTILSYDYLGQINLMANNTEGAIDAYERAQNQGLELDYFMIRRMGELYGQTEQYEKQIEMLKIGMESYADSNAMVIDMANAYINVDDSEKALETLRILIDRDPDNAEYRLVYASRAYSMVDVLSKQMKELYDENFDIEHSDADKAEVEAKVKANNERIAQLEKDVATVNNDVISELEKAIEINPENARAHYVLGAVRQNQAVSTQEKRNATEDNDEYEKLDKLLKEQLNAARVSYEKAAEIDSDNTDYWNSLFQVYTSLGMMKEAEEAMKKAGI